MIPEYVREIQKLWEESFKTQIKMFENMIAAMNNLIRLNIMQDDIAVFRVKIQSGGRISIPEAERSALGLKDGDIVKVIICLLYTSPSPRDRG